MQYKIGKVKDYENNVGKIITPDREYMFLDTDTEEEIKNGDLVKFWDEENKYDRAFFVKKIGPKKITRN